MSPITPGLMLPAGGEVEAWLEEDFSTYASTTNLKTNPREIYSDAFLGDGNESYNTSRIYLDQAVGYGGLTQSMRYDYPSTSQANYTLGVNLVLPTSTAELWLEVVFKTSVGFSLDGPLTTSPGLKFLFGRVTDQRYNFVLGGGGATVYTVGYPLHEDGWEGGDNTGLFDGNWHTVRWHMKNGVSGACRLLIDGVVVKDYGTVNVTASNIYGIALARNMNEGVTNPQSLWWGRIRVYNADPGSGW